MFLECNIESKNALIYRTFRLKQQNRHLVPVLIWKYFIIYVSPVTLVNYIIVSNYSFPSINRYSARRTAWSCIWIWRTYLVHFILWVVQCAKYFLLNSTFIVWRILGIEPVPHCSLKQVSWNRVNVFPTGWCHCTYGLSIPPGG